MNSSGPSLTWSRVDSHAASQYLEFAIVNVAKYFFLPIFDISTGPHMPVWMVILPLSNNNFPVDQRFVWFASLQVSNLPSTGSSDTVILYLSSAHIASTTLLFAWPIIMCQVAKSALSKLLCDTEIRFPRFSGMIMVARNSLPYNLRFSYPSSEF